MIIVIFFLIIYLYYYLLWTIRSHRRVNNRSSSSINHSHIYINLTFIAYVFEFECQSTVLLQFFCSDSPVSTVWCERNLSSGDSEVMNQLYIYRIIFVCLLFICLSIDYWHYSIKILVHLERWFSKRRLFFKIKLDRFLG